MVDIRMIPFFARIEDKHREHKLPDRREREPISSAEDLIPREFRAGSWWSIIKPKLHMRSSERKSRKAVEGEYRFKWCMRL